MLRKGNLPGLSQLILVPRTCHVLVIVRDSVTRIRQANRHLVLVVGDAL